MRGSAMSIKQALSACLLCSIISRLFGSSSAGFSSPFFGGILARFLFSGQGQVNGQIDLKIVPRSKTRGAPNAAVCDIISVGTPAPARVAPPGGLVASADALLRAQKWFPHLKAVGSKPPKNWEIALWFPTKAWCAVNMFYETDLSI